MYKNYEKRVKNFILEMNEPETKIEIKNYKGPINNPKTDMAKEREIQKPFIFKGYTTEEDRIKDSIKRNRYLFNLPDYEDEVNTNKEEKKEVGDNKNINNFNTEGNNYFNKLSKNVKLTRKNIISKTDENKYKYILKNDLIIQPEMRFKPRTDLERIYDMINGYKYGIARRDILDKQLKNMGLFKYKNSNELKRKITKEIKSEIKSEIKADNSNSSSENDGENENNHIHSHIEKINPGKSKLYFNPDTIDYKAKPWMKRTDLNADAYKLLNSYHYKTHFKAAKEVAGNNIKSKEKNNNNNKKNKNKYCLLLPNLFQNKSTNNFEILNPAYNDIKNKSNELIEINMEEGEDDEKQNKEEMQIKYDKNKNPFKKKLIFEEDKVKLIGDIAFKKKVATNRISEDNFFDENKLLFEKNIDEENIMIDDKIFSKKNQFELITSRILDKCNIFNHKSKFNNTILKKRNGKLMFTRGLSINQFEKKYGFN
jgi:hypothetical protein